MRIGVTRRSALHGADAGRAIGGAIPAGATHGALPCVVRCLERRGPLQRAISAAAFPSQTAVAPRRRYPHNHDGAGKEQDAGRSERCCPGERLPTLPRPLDGSQIIAVVSSRRRLNGQVTTCTDLEQDQTPGNGAGVQVTFSAKLGVLHH